MKAIGLIGGLSWESSAEYYRLLNRAVRDRLGGLHKFMRREDRPLITDSGGFQIFSLGNPGMLAMPGQDVPSDGGGDGGGGGEEGRADRAAGASAKRPQDGATPLHLSARSATLRISRNGKVPRKAWYELVSTNLYFRSAS